MAQYDTERTVDAATRVAAGDDGTNYDSFAITLHWLTVALVLTQFVTSQIWEYFARPTRHLLVVAHMSFGMLLAAVIVVRIIWRLIPGHQKSSLEVGFVRLLSKGVHYLLYTMLVVQAVLGFVMRWSGNEAMNFFGLHIAPPFAPFSKPAQHLVGDMHEWLGWIIVIVALGHAGAALFHHFVMKDRVLQRMLPLVSRR